ncbi:MAG TPA: transposase [Candidatus Caccocola faecigallinarum]|nr:transposase [Candidatus Caccocola faecigallinarum]
MEAEIHSKPCDCNVGRTVERSGYRSGHRVRKWNTRTGTMYLLMPKVRNGGYIPFFLTARKRSEAALIQVVQEAYIQSVSTHKMERLARSPGIDNMPGSYVSELTKGLNGQAWEFRSRNLSGDKYPVIWADVLYEKVRKQGRS